jgi:gas vesicle protein
MSEANTENNSARNAVIAFAAGALAGGVAMLLTAPRKGSEMRHRLAEGTGEFVRDTRDRVAETARDMGNTVRGRKDAVKQAASAAKEAYREEMENSSGEKTE